MVGEPNFDHLLALSTPLGLFEHADGPVPRPEHGFCVDDVARGLVVTSRHRGASTHVVDLASAYLKFLLDAQCTGGRMHNRRNVSGAWTDAPSTDDHWGRAIWAFGTAGAEFTDPEQAARAREATRMALVAKSKWPRANAYAVLGAGRLLEVEPTSRIARGFLVRARQVLVGQRIATGWPWPEARLTYANAVLPEAMIVIGSSLQDRVLLTSGLRLLDWLVAEQTREGHLSVVPSTGRSPEDHSVGYAQQPIEVAALAEAANTAWRSTGNPQWLLVIASCRSWFEGDNDEGLRMYDPITGGGYDGLERGLASRNQGAESTLAWLATEQIAQVALSAAPA